MINMVHKTKKGKILLGIMPMKEYQAMMERKADRDIQEWHEGKREMMPQIAFYKFYTPSGSERKSGYVLRYGWEGTDRTGNIVFKTKKEAMASWEKGDI